MSIRILVSKIEQARNWHQNEESFYETDVGDEYINIGDKNETDCDQALWVEEKERKLKIDISVRFQFNDWPWKWLMESALNISH